MFLSVQVFSKSPEGKGLNCKVKDIVNKKESFFRTRLLYWFDKEKYLEFTVHDVNAKIEWSDAYKYINDTSGSYWKIYSFDAEFIKEDRFNFSEYQEGKYLLKINRKNLELTINHTVIYNNNAYPKGSMPRENYQRNTTGTCEVVKSKEEFDDILEEEKQRINKSYRKNKI